MSGDPRNDKGAPEIRDMAWSGGPERSGPCPECDGSEVLFVESKISPGQGYHFKCPACVEKSCRHIHTTQHFTMGTDMLFCHDCHAYRIGDGRWSW